MKLVTLQSQVGQFGIAHFGFRRIFIRVDRRLHGEAGFCGCTGDEVDDRLVIDQRLSVVAYSP